MVYYKVKSDFDGKQLYKRPGQRGYTNVGRVPNGWYLVSDELLTKKELFERNVPIDCVSVVEVNKNKTYFCFGARFEM